MKNYIFYLGMLILTTIISFLIYIYIITLKEFVNHVFVYFVFYVIVSIISVLSIHYLKTIIFMLICKLKKQKYSVICLYPFVWINGKLIILFGPSNYVFYKNLCDLSDVDLENFNRKYYQIKCINNKGNVYIVLLSLILFVVGLYWKLYLLLAPLFSCVLYKVTIDFLNSFKDIDNIYFFDELLFANISNTELINWHINYLEKNIMYIINKPNEILNCLKLMITINKYNLKDDLCKLDDIIELIVLRYGKIIRIECMDLIFDYIDLRICLNKECNKSKLFLLLDLFCKEKNWDFQIIDLYSERINELKKYLNNTAAIEMRRKIYKNIIK